ncbi:hypothetical protein [Paraburkholderia aspalathi]|uniref:hypothetical protein n=1 Tax=Paraburkholderia aspalathi TaxID=1324617 RepID=UPI001FD3065F|nr:hypothetical protein [Paraburkholderia aspalathi]
MNTPTRSFVLIVLGAVELLITIEPRSAKIPAKAKIGATISTMAASKCFTRMADS